MSVSMHQSFISYKNYRYGRWALLLSLAAILAYIMDSPSQPANGGTWLGYALGSIAAAIILFLMWFGVRKRTYHSSLGSVSGWLSAHVYFGAALLILATLHCGFQFGWNVHTLTYALMCGVVGSGAWGVYTYLKYPGLMLRHRRDLSREALFQRVKELDRRALRLAGNLDLRLHDLVADAIRRAAVGGEVWAQLTARDDSKILLPVDMCGLSGARLVDNGGQQTLIDILADRQAGSSDDQEITYIKELLEITGNKAALMKKLQKEIQLQGLVQIWLYFHLPMSFALLVSLMIHVMSVFLYW